VSSSATPKGGTVEIWKDDKGFWWHVRAGNGRIVDGGTQPYGRYRDLQANMRLNKQPCPLAWERLAIKATRSRDRRWKWEYANAEAA
jgi:hypothetical protein